jgi:hypothetical protein
VRDGVVMRDNVHLAVTQCRVMGSWLVDLKGLALYIIVTAVSCPSPRDVSPSCVSSWYVNRCHPIQINSMKELTALRDESLLYQSPKVAPGRTCDFSEMMLEPALAS